MSDDYSKTNLLNIADGALPELFALELERVAANIDDINAPAKQKRTITIEISFKPDSSRYAVEITAVVKSKLAASKPAESVMFIARDRAGRVTVLNENVKQGDLPLEPRPLRVVPDKGPKDDDGNENLN